MNKTENLQPAPQNLETSSPLTPELASDIFFASFEHSQGSSEIQQELFMALKIFNPDWKIDNAIKARIRENAMPSIQHVIARSQPLITRSKTQEKTIMHAAVGKGKDASVKTETKKILDDMQKVFESAQESKDINTEELAIHMLERDKKYLVRPAGRPRRNIDPATPRGDPFLSYVCYYGLNRNTTGILELDKIYKLINDFLRKPRCFQDNRNRLLLYSVLQAYNVKHPNAQVEGFFRGK